MQIKKEPTPQQLPEQTEVSSLEPEAEDEGRKPSTKESTHSTSHVRENSSHAVPIESSELALEEVVLSKKTADPPVYRFE